ncbi:kunitz-type protease inhibitor 3-like isoform X2 [Antechinus flavipes]|nr:kunitz-type protease inhibitor 3-like isoform X2 [Antechinus flavipes]
MAQRVLAALLLFPLILPYLDLLLVSAKQKNKTLPNICHLPREEGECLAYMPKWYYNPKSGTCELFIYGGCRGNENRFDTRKHCRKICAGPDLCKFPLKVGSCATPQERWFYDWTVKKCKKFFYSGCDGNLNNFRDERQ